jgi:hypothetical protein
MNLECIPIMRTGVVKRISPGKHVTVEGLKQPDMVFLYGLSQLTWYCRSGVGTGTLRAGRL